MKKYIFIIILCYFNVSCQTYNPIGMPYMSDIYISPRNAAADDTYIILREQPKVFEIQYSSQIGSVTFGGWNMMNDTLYLYALADYISVWIWMLSLEFLNMLFYWDYWNGI